MPKKTNKDDEDDYIRDLQNPEEFWSQFPRRLESGALPRKQKVGYGRPPTRSQFKPGHSGNPKGRPPGSKNLRSAIEAILTDQITLREGDKVSRVTRMEAVFLKQLSLALKGDPRAIKAICETAKSFGMLEARPDTLRVGQLSSFTVEELEELERLLHKANAWREPQ